MLCLDNFTITVGNNNIFSLCVCLRNGGGPLLKSYRPSLLVFMTQWKHAYFTSFFAEWWMLWARWPTVFAVISGWQLSSFLETTSFLSSWTQTSLLSEGQHLLVLKDVSGLWSSTLTARWPFPIPQPYLTHTGLHRSTRGDMCLTLYTTRGCFILLHTVMWMDKQNVFHIDRP